MDREQAKDIVKGYLGDYLKGNGINTRKPFSCLNPAHPDKHPSMSYDSKTNRCKCFSCGASYDIFDLIGMDYGLTDPGEIFKKAYELYNVDIDSQKTPAKKPSGGNRSETQANGILPDILKAKEAFAGSPAEHYINMRGISTETAARFWLGYNGNFKTKAEAEDGQTAFAEWQVLIIPTGRENYVARTINKPTPPEKKNRYRKKGASLIFNNKALYNAQKPVYVVEGEIDALSIIEVGGEALALGSVSNTDSLLQMVKKQRPAQPLILALDKDEAGKKAEEDLAAQLTALQIPFYRHDICGWAKDANEALVQDREAFAEMVADGERKREQEEAAQKEAQKEEYLKTSAASALQDFEAWIKDRTNTQAISTGFSQLDSVLDGGLYTGLYVLGAISSLGKTTLALQIADQIAQQGQDVLIFSLEMAKNELIAKSISRHTFLKAGKQWASSTRDIMARYYTCTPHRREVIGQAQAAYKEYAGQVFIHEGKGEIGVQKIEDVVKQHIAITGNIPVIMIDYIQILAPYYEKGNKTDKQNPDKNVLELKRLSRDYKTPVFGISSFNRDSYKTGGKSQGRVSMTDYKESGTLEYSADVLIGLEFAGAGSKDYNEKIEKQKSPRNVRLVILKNRNGKAWQTADFDFYAAFNCYEETDREKAIDEEYGDGWEDETEDTAAAQDPFAALRDKPAK